MTKTTTIRPVTRHLPRTRDRRSGCTAGTLEASRQSPLRQFSESVRRAVTMRFPLVARVFGIRSPQVQWANKEQGIAPECLRFSTTP